jgi:predicted O-methyltransferase YrrM
MVSPDEGRKAPDMKLSMDPELQSLLLEIYETGRRHDALEPEHDRRMLNLEPEAAFLVSATIRLGKRTLILEVGTSNGYSTIWLAWAAQTTGGELTSVERNSDKLELADRNLRRAGLREHVHLMLGDATEVLASLPGPFDTVFFDADRISSHRQLEILLPKLSDDVLLLADNALSHPDELRSYLAAVANIDGFDHVILPVGKGLSFAYRSSASSQSIGVPNQP